MDSNPNQDNQNPLTSVYPSHEVDIKNGQQQAHISPDSDGIQSPVNNVGQPMPQYQPVNSNANQIPPENISPIPPVESQEQVPVPNNAVGGNFENSNLAQPLDQVLPVNEYAKPSIPEEKPIEAKESIKMEETLPESAEDTIEPIPKPEKERVEVVVHPRTEEELPEVTNTAKSKISRVKSNKVDSVDQEDQPETAEKVRSGVNKYLLFGGISALVILIGLGIYYWYSTKTEEDQDTRVVEYDDTTGQETEQVPTDSNDEGDEDSDISENDEAVFEVETTTDTETIKPGDNFALTISYENTTTISRQNVLVVSDFGDHNDAINFESEESDSLIEYQGQTDQGSLSWIIIDLASQGEDNSTGEIVLNLSIAESVTAGQEISGEVIMSLEDSSDSISTTAQSFSLAIIGDGCGDSSVDDDEDFDIGEVKGKLVLDTIEICGDIQGEVSLTGDEFNETFGIGSENDDTLDEPVNTTSDPEEVLLDPGEYTYSIKPDSICEDNNQGQLSIIECQETLLSESSIELEDDEGSAVALVPALVLSINGATSIDLTAGSEATYSLKYTNPTDEVLKDVVIKNPFVSEGQDKLSFVSQTSKPESNFNETDMQWNVGNVQPGEGGKIDLIVEVDASEDVMVTSYMIKNMAYLEWDGGKIDSDEVEINVSTPSAKRDIILIIAAIAIVIFGIVILYILIRKSR